MKSGRVIATILFGSRSHLFYTLDKNNGYNFLFDTGAAVSVIPAKVRNKTNLDHLILHRAVLLKLLEVAVQLTIFFDRYIRLKNLLNCE